MLNAMLNAPPWIQRVTTYAIGVGVAVVGAKVQGLSGLVALGALIVGTAIPHPADSARGSDGPPGPPATVG